MFDNKKSLFIYLSLYKFVKWVENINTRQHFGGHYQIRCLINYQYHALSGIIDFVELAQLAQFDKTLVWRLHYV